MEPGTLSENELRRQMIFFCRMLYDRGLLAATDGNLSARFGPEQLLITPSGVSKATVREEQLVVIDFQGNLVAGTGKPSSEIRMHLACYLCRPELGAVIHAHPPTGVALTLAGVSLAHCVMPEVVLTFGHIPTAPYALPASDEMATAIQELIGRCDGMLLDRHGALTVGTTLEEAYNKMDKLEHAAEITLLARRMGQVRLLPKQEVERLLELRGRLGLRHPILGCIACGACLPPDSDTPPKPPA